jgi:hypothetical protein
MEKLYPAQAFMLNFIIGITITHIGAQTISWVHDSTSPENIMQYLIVSLFLAAAVLYAVKRKLEFSTY